MTDYSAGSHVAAALRDGGVRRVWGAETPFDGVPFVAVAEPELAALLAGADAALHGVGCSSDGRGVLRLHAAPGGNPDVHVAVDDARLVAAAVRRALGDVGFGVDVTLAIDVDPTAPCPTSSSDVLVPEPDPDPVIPDDVLHALSAPDAIVVAGPGVLRDGVVAELRRLAVAANVGVLNTWGAKGLFAWTDPHHLATGGLQRDDFALAGAAGGTVVAVGVDPAETTGLGDPTATLACQAVAAVTDATVRRGGRIDVPPLRSALETVVARWWSAPPSRRPSPAVVTRAYAELVGAGGLVAAEPGDAGFWVARTFPTLRPRQAVVPARVTPGVAVATAYVARLGDASRRALAVTDRSSPVDDAVVRIAELAGLPLTTVHWDDAADDHLDVHLAALDASWRNGGGTFRIAVDRGCRHELEEIAGPVVAWTAQHPV